MLLTRPGNGELSVSCDACSALHVASFDYFPLAIEQDGKPHDMTLCTACATAVAAVLCAHHASYTAPETMLAQWARRVRTLEPA